MPTPHTAAPDAAAPLRCDAVIVGGGPAGLMAAEVLAQAGVAVHLFDAMPSVGRKFLLAGKGGLNLTHSEPHASFATRFGERQPQVEPAIESFGGPEIGAWAKALGVDTFVGTSGRVFPADMKAAPLLRAWLHRLRGLGVQFHMRHKWLGWQESPQASQASLELPTSDVPEPGQPGQPNPSDQRALRFSAPSGEVLVHTRALVLALGGASWARLGSDGAWVPLLVERGVVVAPLRPTNCGFDVLRGQAAPTGETRRAFLQELLGRTPEPTIGWTPHFAERFAGQPFKTVALDFTDSQGRSFNRRGEFVVTASGVEGSLVYAASHLLRDEIAAHGHATFHLDLLPDHTAERVLVEVRHPRGSRSLSSHLKSRLNLDGIKAGVLYEHLGKDGMNDPVALARAIKALPMTVVATRPIDEAISTAGGVAFEAMDAHLMATAAPGVFCAGEMLDWEAPTGGYLMTASMATGRVAGAGALAWLQKQG